MPRVAVDILTPKQALLFNEVARLFRKRGVEADCTTRRYYEAEEMLRDLGLGAQTIGKHGGATLQGKLEAYAERVRGLASYYSKLKPKVVLSFSSPEAARSAFGLSIPHVSVNDSPHASAVARLTIPLSSFLLSPWIIPLKEWRRFGIENNRIVRYRALDPASWLKRFKPSRRVLDELGLDADRPIVTFRPHEYLAAYLQGKGRDVTQHVARVMTRLLGTCPDIQIVVVSRYGHASKYKSIFGKTAVVTEKIIDGRSLLYHSSLFVGGGGTMTAESALLGVPTISVYPGTTIVEDYLVKKGLVVKATRNLYKHAVHQIQCPARELRLLRTRAAEVLEKMEDPAARIVNVVEKMLRR